MFSVKFGTLLENFESKIAILVAKAIILILKKSRIAQNLMQSNGNFRGECNFVHHKINYLSKKTIDLQRIGCRGFSTSSF